MPELGPELIRRRREIDLLELEFSRLAYEFSQTDEYDLEGSVSPIDWIRHNCHLTGPAAADRVNVGEHAGRLAESVQAVVSGEIGFAHLSVLARTAEWVGDRFDERRLLDKALENSPGKLRYLCDHYRHACHPERFGADQAELIEQRRLKLSGYADGTVTLSGILDPAGGAALRNALEPLARPLGPDDERELEQRMADALVELASGGEQKAQIQVTATVETLMGLVGSAAADMDFSFPLCSETVQRLACEAGIARVLFDSESMVIDVGRTRRQVPVATRRALEARDRGCKWPGCERPPKRCAAHHLHHWFKGGPTDQPNLLLLCHRHHTLVHEGRWQIIRSVDGQVVTVPPLMTFINPWMRAERAPVPA
jgi:hypothetical protein